MSFVSSSRKTLFCSVRYFHNCFVPPPYHLTIYEYFSSDTRTRPEFMAECKI
jgi:hypothetical protein